MTTQTFWLPTRPYNIIAAVNRMALATGSVRSALVSEGVDYNGHHVGFVEPNQFKKYWTCYYTWAGIRTIGRGTLADCLKAAKEEYDRGALGASAVVQVSTQEDAEACIAAGFVLLTDESEKAHNASWRTTAHDAVGEAFTDAKWGIFPEAVSVLCTCSTREEYRAKRQAHLDAVKGR